MPDATIDVSLGTDDLSPARAPDADECPCGHPGPEHDAVARRYCAATASGALDRNCICQVAPPKPYRYG